MCLFPRRKSTTRFGRSPFFLGKVTVFIGRETKTHILPTKSISISNNNCSSSTINHSTTTTTSRTTTTVCVLGETKSLSTSTRSGVRRSAYESAHTQQSPLKMHVETWAGFCVTRARRFSGGGNRTRVCFHCGLSFIS